MRVNASDKILGIEAKHLRKFFRDHTSGQFDANSIKYWPELKLTSEEKIMKFFEDMIKEGYINKKDFNTDMLHKFAQLDDFDVLAAIKEWQYHSDPVLSDLCEKIINRKLFRIEIFENPISKQKLEKKQNEFLENYNIDKSHLEYFVFTGKATNQAYNYSNPIHILNKRGQLMDITEASDQLNLKALQQPVVKHFICYPK